MDYVDALIKSNEILQDHINDLRDTNQFLREQLGLKKRDCKPELKAKLIQLDVRKYAV